MRVFYGLPESVVFCRTCVVSNQRPNSCVEFSHTAESKKETIRFDADGICDACRVAERKKLIDWKERELELLDMLARYRGNGIEPDVVVPGSGGKDSVFAAHILKHKYGMTPLLVTWAPSIYTDVGLRNLQRWQSISHHQLYTPNREVNRLLVRLSVETLFHPFACFIYGQKALAPKVAALHGIKLVMFGESESEYGDPKENAGSAVRDRKFHAGASEDIFLGGVPLNDLHIYYRLRANDLAPYLPSNADVDVRYLGYYLKWHPQSAYYYAVEHGGFEAAPERTPGTYSKYNSIDDKIDDFHYYTTWIKFGIGRATYDAAQEIRSGDITRSEGVALVHRFDGEYPARFESEIFDYLSVPGFKKMDRGYFLDLCERFKSPHLWEGERLRHRVS